MRVLALCVLAIVLGGCGRPAAQTAHNPLADIPPAKDLPALQQPLLADGSVTPDEYRAAYNAFARCVSEGNGRIEELGRDQSSGLIQYRVGNKLGTPMRPDLNSIEGHCFHDTFDSVEYIFNLTDPVVLAAALAEDRRLYRDQVRPCLIKNGIQAPPETDAGTDGFLELSSSWSDLQRDGKC